MSLESGEKSLPGSLELCRYQAHLTLKDIMTDTCRLQFQMHCRTNPNFDFHKYMMRALEDDFKKVVGIRYRTPFTFPLALFLILWLIESFNHVQLVSVALCCLIPSSECARYVVSGFLFLICCLLFSMPPWRNMKDGA